MEPITNIAVKIKEPGYFADYYEILGIARFGDYDPKCKNMRIGEARREILDNDLRDEIEDVIIQADDTLKDSSLRIKYDKRLNEYLGSKSKRQNISYGSPKIEVDGQHKTSVAIEVLEAPLNSKVNSLFYVRNAANTGTLDVRISILEGSEWLSISTNRITQNELHLPITLSVDTTQQGFSRGTTKVGKIQFEYPTDKGSKLYKLPVLISIEGAEKQALRFTNLFKIGSVITYALLSILVLFIGKWTQTYNFIYIGLILGSVYYLYYLIDNILKSNSFKDFFVNTKYIFYSFGVFFLLLIFNFELFLFLFLSVLGVFFLRFFGRKPNFVDKMKFLPLVLVLVYSLIVFPSPLLRRNFSYTQPQITNPEPVRESPENNAMSIMLLVDCNVRSSPSSRGEKIGVAKKGEQLRIINENVTLNSWIEIDYNNSKGYIYFTSRTGEIKN